MATTLTIHEFNNSRINNSSPPPNATFLTYGNGHDSEGLKKANSTKFFTLFGEYRIDPPDPEDDITDRGFTGHKHNDDIELIYMNARYYVPAIGRFASADTIVPEPFNPQTYNRYSYVTNNPIMYVDPSGHDLMIVGGFLGDADPDDWRQWIMAYKGWSQAEWEQFYTDWSAISTFAGQNAFLNSHAIRIFTWGDAYSIDDVRDNAQKAFTRDMVDELAKQMEGMKDVTLLAWSKGGNLALHYLQRVVSGQVEGIVPRNAILLAPGTNPYLAITHKLTLVSEEVPEPIAAVNICSYRDKVCPLEIRNAENINLEKSAGHGPHGNLAEYIFTEVLSIQWHHGARRPTYSYNEYAWGQYNRDVAPRPEPPQE